MINLPKTLTTNKPFKHIFDGNDPKKESFVLIHRITDTDFDFKYQDYLTKFTGYLSYQDMLESISIMDIESKGERVVAFERGRKKAERYAFVDCCIAHLVIDGEVVEDIEDMKEPYHEVTVSEWLAIASNNIFYYKKLEDEAEEQLKKS